MLRQAQQAVTANAKKLTPAQTEHYRAIALMLALREIELAYLEQRQGAANYRITGQDLQQLGRQLEWMIFDVEDAAWKRRGDDRPNDPRPPEPKQTRPSDTDWPEGFVRDLLSWSETVTAFLKNRRPIR